MAIRGLSCSNCGSPLNRPFKVTMCFEDGTEKILKNKIPKDIDDKICVVVYRHKSCTKQGADRRRYSRNLGVPIELSDMDNVSLEGIIGKYFSIRREGRKVMAILPLVRR